MPGTVFWAVRRGHTHWRPNQLLPPLFECGEELDLAAPGQLRGCTFIQPSPCPSSTFPIQCQVLDDVSEEHARKTITVEAHPNLSLTAASIHPCRHSETMKRLMTNIQEGGGSFAVEQ